ncbi:MAG: methylmalonyl-CoA carboxyltransferase [Clostridia bacterium]|nr:methylmalonyl-CoA carboxyltransferase [Clostridia bacterium]
MSSMEKISDLIARKEAIALGGGKEKLEKQKQNGSMTARERIEALLDEGSFVEIGAFISARGEETAADGVITGYGSVDSRLVYVYSQDVTVLGGAMGEMYANKINKIVDMAAKMGAPVIGMLDSNGVRLSDGPRVQRAMGRVLSAFANISGVVPHISIVFGNCAGGSAIAAAMSDFVVMNEKTGKMFVTGPDIIEATEGEAPSVDAKGSVNKNGNAHLIGKDDLGCIEITKLLLSYIPSNNLSDAFIYETADDLSRPCDILNDIENITDARVVIAEIADDKAFFEIQSDYAKEASIGFIRVNGSTVGVIATNEAEISNLAAQKMERFVRFCDCYNTPIVTITDVEGFRASANEETWGLARKSAELMYAFVEATVPKINIITKKAYGTAYTLLNSKQGGADLIYAYPTAEMAPLPPAAGVGVLYSERLKAGESREALEKEYIETEASIYNAAKLGCVDDIIIPSETRARIAAALEMLRSKRAGAISKKHDNMSL